MPLPYYQDESCTIYHGDCREILPGVYRCPSWRRGLLLFLPYAGEGWWAMTVMRKPRWAQRFYAWTHNYFWLPCPICGQRFGGHEWLVDDHHTLWPAVGHGEGTCPDCWMPASVVQTWMRRHD